MLPLDDDHDRIVVAGVLEDTEAVVSPVVLPAAVVAELDAWPDLDDVPAWVESLRERWPVTFLAGPPNARRVSSEDDLAGLQDARG